VDVEKLGRLERVADGIREKLGTGAIQRASLHFRDEDAEE
jgi:hypothetical protein